MKANLERLPGFGSDKAAIFTAVLGKLRGITPDGWRDAAGYYGEPDTFRSVADIVDSDSLQKVRETKKSSRPPRRRLASTQDDRQAQGEIMTRWVRHRRDRKRRNGTVAEVRRSRPYHALVAIGLVSYGLLHLVLAWIALQIVLGKRAMRRAKAH